MEEEESHDDERENARAVTSTGVQANGESQMHY